MDCFLLFPYFTLPLHQEVLEFRLHLRVFIFLGGLNYDVKELSYVLGSAGFIVHLCVVTCSEKLKLILEVSPIRLLRICLLCSAIIILILPLLVPKDPADITTSLTTEYVLVY